MISAHVVTTANKHLYTDHMDEFLRRRHDFFVTQKGWRPPSPTGREVDQFDTDAATYILGIEDGRVVTSARLIPTSEPTMISEVFPDLCEMRALPRRRDWAEWTRTFVLPEKRSFSRRGTLTELSCAVMEYAIDEGLAALCGVQETYFMPRHAALGWRALPLGLPRQFGDETYVVAYIDVSEEALESVRRILGIDHPLLVRRGMVRPFQEPTQVHVN